MVSRLHNHHMLQRSVGVLVPYKLKLRCSAGASELSVPEPPLPLLALEG